MKNIRAVFCLLLSLAALVLCGLVVSAWIRLGELMPRPVPGAFGIAVVVDCQPFNNVVADGVATIDFGDLIGRTVDRITLQLGGTALTKAMLSNIRILANNKPIFEDSGSRTDDRNEYRGITADASFLSLDFSEIRSHSNADKYAGALDTRGAGIVKLTGEVTIAGATAPTLAAQAEVRPSPQSSNPVYNGLLAKVMNRTQNFAAAGEFLFAMPLRADPNTRVKRVFLHGATVTAARVKKTYANQVTDEIFKATDAQNDRRQTEYGRTPQANVFCIDFMPDGNVQDCLRLGDAQAMQWFLTTSGAGNVVIVTELLDPLANN